LHAHKGTPSVNATALKLNVSGLLLLSLLKRAKRVLLLPVKVGVKLTLKMVELPGASKGVVSGILILY
jgi:hypothetical protein